MVTEGHPHHSASLIQQHQQHQQRRFLQQQQQQANEERAMVIQQHPGAGEVRHSPSSGASSLNSVHQSGASMEEQTAALRAAAAAAAAAAAFGSGNLPVGMNLNPAELMSQLQQHQQSQQQDAASNASRKQREFIPDNKKDDSYWDRRRRNNEAAKRSREKRRLNDMVLESRVLDLTKENHILRAQLSAVRDKYGINPDGLISIDQVLATLPSPDQVLSLPRPRSRLLLGGSGLGSVSPTPSNRSLSPPTLPAHHLHHQQQRQSVLMSMSRQQHRSPSPPPMQHGQLAFSGGHHHHGYRYESSLPSSIQQQYSQQQQQQQQQQQPMSAHQQVKQSSVNRTDRALPPLPALTPVPVHSPEEGAVEAQGGADRSGAGHVAFFDLCSSSSSSQHGGDDGSASPIDPAAAGGRLLPHKLRHKSHLGDREAAASAALLTLNEIKHEPEAIDDSPSPANSVEMNNNHSAGGHSGRRSTESIEDRDSGISSAGEWSVYSRQTSSTARYHANATPHLQQPAAKRMRMSPVPAFPSAPGHQQQQQQQQRRSARPEDDEDAGMINDPSAASDARNAGYDSMDEADMRAQFARLASELELLKSYMLGNNSNNNNGPNAPTSGAQQQAIRNNNKTNSPNATYRLH
uniref:EOG090X08JU n=1 Tax=Moina brachiata TaxID=675436 RepID=A0A4Y7NIN7_9CRUS|nr:EOG090X08JU [Moina brachiata]SVE93091.1 EOG090X08JU [Moina brachiata]